MTDELVGTMALLLTDRVGGVRYRRLIDHFGSAARALGAPARELAGAMECSITEATKIASSLALDEARSEIARARDASVQVVGCWEDGYPELLREVNGPPLLFVKGDLPSLHAPSVAIVGTRKPTPYGRSQARKIAQRLAEAGLVVVSGLAFGVDSEAHRGTLAARGRTVAVQGCGLGAVYPARNAELAEEIIQTGGALVSELPMGFPVRAENFPRRNRIISGLAMGTLVVEAAKRSGALITASSAAEQGRDIFALPGPATSLQSMGTNALIRDGASLVTCAEDILEELRLGHLPLFQKIRMPAEEPAAPAPAPGAKGDGAEANVLGALGSSPVEAEELSRATSLEFSTVTACLGRLELSGAVKRVPGGFVRTEKG